MQLGRVLVQSSFYRFLSLAVVFILNIFLTRLMGAEGYGLFSLMIANVTFLNLLTGFGADAAVTYQLASGKISISRLGMVILLLLIIQIIIATAIDVGVKYHSGHYWLYQHFFWIGIIYFITVSLVDKYTALYNGQGFYTSIYKILFITNTCILGLFAATFSFYPGNDAEFYVRCFVLFYAIQILIIIIIFYRITNPPFPFAKIKINNLTPFFSYSIISFITNVIQFLAYRIDYWFMDYYHPGSSLGIYVLAVRLSQVFWVMPVAFAGIIFPVTAKLAGINKQSVLLTIIRFLNIINILIALLILLFANRVIPFVFGYEYAATVLPFLYLLPGVILFCTGIILAAYYAGINKLPVNLAGSVLCFCIIFLFDILLIPKEGATGAAIASTIGYSATGIYYMLYFMKENRCGLLVFLIPEKQDWMHFKELSKTIFSK
ncbi:MAG: oligosaccharide flippase family protein [Sphingobacteriales bacterium]|nr:oligosaccharide flippase family protein [Sphingobacteriales bacterium]